MTGTILILDDVVTNRIVMKVRLIKACYQVISASSLDEGLEAARVARPDVIVLGSGICAQGVPSALDRLRRDPATSGLPCIVITPPDDPALRALSITAGAAEALSRPVPEAQLLARLRQLLRDRLAGGPPEALMPMGLAEGQGAFDAASVAPQIAVIWGDKATAVSWKHALSQRFGTAPRLISADTALLESGSDAAADIYLISADLTARGDGLRLMAELRARPGSRNAAFCIGVSAGPGDHAADALDLGADEVVADHPTRPGALDEAVARLQACLRRKSAEDAQRQRLASQLRDAVTDPLTGLANRRVAMAQLARISAEANAQDHDYAVMVLDLDHFKRINDRYGHAAGDTVLSAVADRMTQTLSKGCLIARMGGEEFLCLIPHADREAAVDLAQRLCNQVAASPIKLPTLRTGEAMKPVTVTMSIGVAIGGPGEDGPTVLNRADRALLASKASGRNRVTLAVLRPTPVASPRPSLGGRVEPPPLRVRAFG